MGRQHEFARYAPAQAEDKAAGVGRGHNLLAVEDASLDELANLMMADTVLCGGITQCQPLAVLLGGAVAVDAAYTAKRADAVRCPGLALAGRHSHSVQRRGD